jgi:hypothetical protein
VKKLVAGDVLAATTKKLSFSCGILGEIKRALGVMPYAAMGSLAMSNDGGNNTDRTVGCVVRCIHA